MRKLSKSKILAYRQCPRRLWLELHRPELKDDSAAEAVFAIGNEVGGVARQVYDENGEGVFLDLDEIGFAQSFARSRELLAEGRIPVFEAGLETDGALAFADVMLPEGGYDSSRWHMIEVKASTSVKDYQRDDIALQAWVAESAGVELASISLAHVNNSFVYPGGGDYRGLLTEVDFTDEAKSRRSEVEEWLAGAQTVAALTEEPDIAVGDHCGNPYRCSFCAHCGTTADDDVEYPLSSLPRFGAGKAVAVEALGIADLREVPDEFLSDNQRWVRDVTRTGEAWFDAEGAAADLAGLGFPARFLDFETVMFGVPVWKGARPYQQIPFQFSLHRLDESGHLGHEAFLDLSGGDPSEALAHALIDGCGQHGPIFVYNAGFEKRILRELGERFPELAPALQGIISRVVDLYPIAKNRFYHPDQHGSWSLKRVLPAVCPDLSYGELAGVADGGMAVDAFHEALAPETTSERREAIERELLAYCHLDTLGLVRMWEVFMGRC